MCLHSLCRWQHLAKVGSLRLPSWMISTQLTVDSAISIKRCYTSMWSNLQSIDSQLQPSRGGRVILTKLPTDEVPRLLLSLRYPSILCAQN